MRFRFFYYLVLCCALMGSKLSWGALSLELTQGVSRAHPIGIQFLGDLPVGPGDQRVDQVISQDLSNSGEFRVVDTQLASRWDAPLDYAAWRKLGVNEAILAQMSPLGGGRYQLAVRLVDLYGQRDLLDRRYDLSASQWRRVAHAISDAVYEKLTGVRGIFSTKLAYILVQNPGSRSTRYALEISDADGFNPQTLLSSSEPLMSPAWSPDGREIAYVSFENHRASIYLQNLQSGQRSVLSAQPGINGAPAFSPSGQSVALVLSITDNPKIYLLNRGSDQLRALTQGYAIDTEPNFSPDGKSLLFTSNRGGAPQIYRLDLATGSVTRITYAGDYNARARYLPSGKGIVLLHRSEGIFGIATQDLESGRMAVLTRANADESPSVSPNGKMIIYATRVGGRGVLAMVSVDGRIQLRLPAREGNVQEPAWSPFFN